MAKRLTYADIAAHAGLSTASVSRALANQPGVTPEVAERVRASAAALGYRGNRAARALRRQRADAIGLVVSDIENPFFSSIARFVEEEAAKHGDAVLLCNTGESLEHERRQLHRMMGESVSGVIVVPSLEEPGALLELREAGIPTVLLDRRVDGDGFDSVMVDHAGGARALVEHLIVEHGHSHIGALMVITKGTSSRERLRGCRDAVAGHPGARLTEIDAGELAEDGRRRTTELTQALALGLLDRPDAPTAIFAGNNVLALGALRAVRDAQLRVPEDVALVAFDDEPSFDLLQPPLSVAAQPIAQIASTVTELLYRRIAEPDRPAESVVLPAELRLRASCGCAGIEGPAAAGHQTIGIEERTDDE
jgi:DNA-binding LacI/PurR family transcriptional regulator